MSLFDFPRIHFWGTHTINVGTSNNNSLGPGDELTITSDTDHVAPVTNGMSDEAFHKWLQGADEKGLVRGQWNVFGDMSFRFIDVRVTSAQLGYDHLITSPESDPMIGASLFLNNALLCDNNPEGFDTTQVFADSLEIHATEALAGKGIFFSRLPSRATTLSLNWFRNVSFHGILGNDTSGGAGGASASFQLFIPIRCEDLAIGADDDPEIEIGLHAWHPNMQDGKPTSAIAKAIYDAIKGGAKGLTVRYNLYLTYPRIADSALIQDFAAGKRTQNPAIGWVLGTISPAYEGEPQSVTMGRFLKSATSYVNPYRTDHKPYYLAPIVARVDATAKQISIDTVNTLPEDGGDGQKWNMGEVSLGIRQATPPDTDPTTNQSIVTAIAPLQNTKDRFEVQGGLYDLSYAHLDPDLQAAIEDRAHELVLSSSIYGVLMYEPEYMLWSDSTCNYMEEVPVDASPEVAQKLETLGKPHAGKTPLYLLQRGQPIRDSVSVAVEQWKFTPSGDPKNFGFYQYPILLNTEQIVIEPESIPFWYGMKPQDGPGVRMFRFAPQGVWQRYLTGNVLANKSYEQFAAFVRVLPYEDFSTVSEADLTFDIIYDKIFRYYNLILPAMNERLNFADATAWQTVTAARYLMRMTDPDIWNRWGYMPRTRDLSNPRRELLWRFCSKVLKSQGVIVEAP